MYRDNPALTLFQHYLLLLSPLLLSFLIVNMSKKSKILEIAFIEPEFNYEEIPKILPYIFPQGVNFNSNDPLKTYQFYEFILVDADSVEIIHNTDKNNP